MSPKNQHFDDFQAVTNRIIELVVLKTIDKQEHYKKKIINLEYKN